MPGDADGPLPRPAAGAVRGAAVLAAFVTAVSAPPAAADTAGEVSLGWREVWVDGDRAKYRQQLNLDDGPRLFEAAFRWRADTTAASGDLRPDGVSLRLSGVGSPYQSASLAVARAGRYRFSYDRSESEYYYDDVLVLPGDASVEGSTGGDFRTFDFRRVRDRASLSIDVSERTSVEVGFDRYSKQGDGTTVLDAEREEFELERPIDEVMQSVEAGIRHRRERFSVSFTERYRRFDFASSAFLAGSSEGSDPAAPGRLDSFLLEQPYDLASWEHELRLRGRLSDRLSGSVAVIAADVDVDLDAAERSRGTGFSGLPFDRTVTGSGDLDQERALYEVGLDFAVTDRVSLFTRLRDVTLEQSASLDFEGAAASDWDIDTLRAELGGEWSPSDRLHLAGGWRSERRDVDRSTRLGGAPSPAEGQDTDADGYFARLSYRPGDRFRIRMTVEDDSLDDPFTLASPTRSRRYVAKASYRWRDAVTLSGSYRLVDRENDNSGWDAESEQIEARVAYAGERVSLSAGVGRTDLGRQVDAVVTAGTSQASFDIDYRARADVVDVSVAWRVSGATRLGASARRYDNDRSFPVTRDDVRVYLKGSVGPGYGWGLDYRNVDFEEGGIESFDADVLELSFGVRW